jgi:biotin carboxylase
MVKPVDNGGGVGMSICYNQDELIIGSKNAIHNSRKKLFLTERYMKCDDIVAYYTFQDGEVYLSAIADRVTTKKQGISSPVCIASIYPSKHHEEYYKKIHPIMMEMFKGLGINNGVLAIQFFVENDNYYAYDPGFRLQGEAMHIHINKINGFDHRTMLINFALTGSMGIKDL